jgi:hypothetical protein
MSFYQRGNKTIVRSTDEIAFPQQDLHMDTVEQLRISIEDVQQEKPEDGND